MSCELLYLFENLESSSPLDWYTGQFCSYTVCGLVFGWCIHCIVSVQAFCMHFCQIGQQFFWFFRYSKILISNLSLIFLWFDSDQKKLWRKYVEWRILKKDGCEFLPYRVRGESTLSTLWFSQDLTFYYWKSLNQDWFTLTLGSGSASTVCSLVSSCGSTTVTVL